MFQSSLFIDELESDSSCFDSLCSDFFFFPSEDFSFFSFAFRMIVLYFTYFFFSSASFSCCSTHHHRTSLKRFDSSFRSARSTSKFSSAFFSASSFSFTSLMASLKVL